MVWRGLLHKYGDRLKVSRSVRPVTLHEGNTPLIRAPRLADAIAPGCDLYLKYEGVNPSGSFKDRGMTAAVTQAVADGSEVVVCASTGNTAASAAAYAARAGLASIVLIPEGNVALGKLAGAAAYGAKIIPVRGSFDKALELVQRLCEVEKITLVNSVNAIRLEGQKTAAWEITEALGAPPDWLCLPVGNAGNITAYWQGFQEEAQPGHPLPQILGAQASGAAPIVLGRRVERPETIATAIRIGNPARWQQATEALVNSNGQIVAVADEEILECYSLAAKLEGVFCEPSSAAGLAALRKQFHAGAMHCSGKRLVAVLTGHGLKDPDTAMSSSKIPKPINADFDSLRKAFNR